MRLRNVKGSREAIARDDRVIEDVTVYKGRWARMFGNDHPIFTEVGMGKGRFLLEMAIRHPEYNYIGIEKYSSVLVRALEKMDAFEGGNVALIRMDAENICDAFAEDEVAGIYLNFSDPWPKDRHAKRRLTSVQYWNRYDQFLQPQGRVVFKTDNIPLFDFSLEQVAQAGWILESFTRDLHHSSYAQGNVMTEYEAKFSAEGRPICRLSAYRDNRRPADQRQEEAVADGRDV